MAKPAPKKKQADHFVYYAVGGALAVVVIGFAIAWFYFQKQSHSEPTVAFSSFGPMVVQGDTFALRTTIAIQTSDDQADWMKSHQQQLEFALKSALTQIDPERVRQPDGTKYVENLLQDDVSKALNTKNIQEVLLTDFVIQSN